MNAFNVLIRASNLIALLLIIATTAMGQISLQPAIGIFGAFNHNMHTADFRTLPGVPGCCPLYESGEGSGISIGLLFDYPLDSAFTLSLRTSYMTQGALLSMSEFMPVEVDGTVTQAEIEHSIDASLSSLGIEPTVAYHITDRFSIHAGLRVAATLGATYIQQEKLVRPDVGTFENDRRIRNEYAGDIPDASSFAAALLCGVSYELPLDDSGELSASPELSFLYGLTPVISNYTWSAHSLRAGVAIRYRLPAEELPAAPPIAPPPPPPATRKPALLVNLMATAVHNGEEKTLDRIVVEEFVSTNVRPLLPYIFFDENSAVLPERYAAISPEAVQDFRVDELHTAGTLTVYHNLLNIIGQRLQANPAATITLTGCNANLGPETGNRPLSQSRAEAVAAYLLNVWKIDAGRLRIAARDLPGIPSNDLESDGAAENRRVEITSNDAGILQPVTTKSTERLITPQQIIFRPAIHAEAGVADWSVQAHQDGAALTSFNGMGLPPADLIWDLAEQFRTAEIQTHPVTYECSASDTEGQNAHSAAYSVPVEHITIQQKRSDETLKDREISRFSLILFDFDKTELNAQNRSLLPMVRAQLQPSSSVSISGYTDRIGEAEYNQRVSLQRARNTATALGIQPAEILGLGESVELFTNDLPEGRLYSRTVNILIETPVGR